jgi:hypothetical protein
MIAKMLLDGDNNYSAREIARLVGTTEGNVFKEKSRLKATGILRDHRFTVLSHSVGDETLTLARAEAKTLVSRSDLTPLTDIPPMGQEDLKKLYAEFQNGRTPVEVIAKYGYNPALVEYEYNRFCRMNGLNLGTLPHDLAGVLKAKNLGISRAILQDIEKDSIKSNDDIRNIFDFTSTSSHSAGRLSVIEHMKRGDPVYTFKPLTCVICQKPMRGALVEFESEIGRKLLQSMGLGAAHDECINGSPPSSTVRY